MNIGMIAKFFYDNNFLVREEMNQDRLKTLVFTAACSLGLEEKVNIEDRSIKIDINYEDYDFKEATTNLLNCINRAIGYNEEYKNSYMFDSILIELGDNVKTTYIDLNKYYDSFKNNILEEFDGYNFSKKNIRLGNNIYFLNFDRDLTTEEVSMLESMESNQKIFEVYQEDGEVILI